MEGDTGGGDGAVWAVMPIPILMPKGFLNEAEEEEVEFEGST